MRKTPLLFRWPILAMTAMLLPGCYLRQAYYVSPFNGNSSDYHALPLATDSARTAVYGSAGFFTGQANDDGNDYYNAGRLEIYASHHGRHLQGYYGVDMTLGGFTMGKWDTVRSYNANRRSGPPLHAAELNGYSGNYTFGGVGFNGGLNLVMPTRGGEWRYIGVEGSLRHEFGDYLSVRRRMPDSLATLIVKNDFFGTLGLSSELIGHTQHGEFGFRLSSGWVLGSSYNNLGIHDNASSGPLQFRYFTGSFHYTYERYTGFVQTNSATKALAFHLGINYRLTRPRPAPMHRRRH